MTANRISVKIGHTHVKFIIYIYGKIKPYTFKKIYGEQVNGFDTVNEY